MYICFMAKTFGASIQTVYNTLQDLANKDQQGFVSPVEFNRFAQVAQLNIFNGLFDELKDVKKLSRSGFDPSRDKSRFKRIQEDLAAFSTKATLPKVSGVFNVSNATSPMARIISMATAGSILLDQSTKKPIEICYDEEKIERILISNLSSPTEEFPMPNKNCEGLKPHRGVSPTMKAKVIYCFGFRFKNPFMKKLFCADYRACAERS